MAAAQQGLDETKVEAFMEKALGDISGMMAVGLCHLGDRLGLFDALAAGGPVGSQELADRLDLNERYVREWLRGLTAAGYLEELEPGSFALPAEHVPALADETGPMFLGGVYQMMPAALAPYERLIEAFRNGGGVRQSDYPDTLWDGMSRFTGSWFESVMVDDWLSTFPHVVEKLERGIDVADVGCGAGRALLVLAQRFPRSRFTGFDNFPGQVERARANAERAGVADRVTFETVDAAQGLPGRYDLVTTFDVIHDSAEPTRLLAALLARTDFNWCSRCGGYAVRRLTDPQLSYCRAAHRLHDLKRQLGGGRRNRRYHRRRHGALTFG